MSSLLTGTNADAPYVQVCARCGDAWYVDHPEIAAAEQAERTRRLAAYLASAECPQDLDRERAGG